MSAIWTVFKKEWLDTRRDLKSILPILLMPILFALVNYGALTFVTKMQQTEPAFVLDVLNGEAAQPLMQALEASGITVRAFDTNSTIPNNRDKGNSDGGSDVNGIHSAIQDGKTTMVLSIPQSFSQDFRAQRIANIELVWDLSRNDQHARANKVKNVINTWLRTISTQRMILRGISPESAYVGRVVDVNIAAERKMAMRIMGSVPLLLVIVAFIAGAGVATEMAAGEREGRTLETLLMTPVANYALLIGKWLMACSLSIGVMVLALLSQLLAIHYAPLSDMGIRFEASWGDYGMIFLLLIPLIFLSNALLLFLSLKARSLKDAQIYTQLVTLLPTATGMYVLLAGEKTQTVTASIPLLGNQALITDVLSGAGMSPLYIVLNTLSCLILTALMGLFSAKAFKLR